jgi:hypothetical protein
MNANLSWTSVACLLLLTHCASNTEPAAESSGQKLQGSLTMTGALDLSETSVQVGDTVTGQVTYTNSTSSAVTITAIAIAGRPPGATHGGGPFDDFTPYAAGTTLQPGQSITAQASRTFSASDPTGTWDVYPTYADASGTWFDGPDSSVSVGVSAVADGALDVTQPLTLSETSAAAGDTVTGTVTLTNDGTTAVVVEDAVLAARPPGGTHAGGPFDDFGPTAPSQTLQPGASLTLTATRTFTAGDPSGAWDLYVTWEDASGTWHDGPDTALTVGSGGGTGGPVASGAFSVSSGQIIGPDGQPFRGKGINVYDADMASVSTDASGAPLTRLFPGINIVRVPVFTYNDPSYYQSFVGQMTALGIVVELEDHTNGAGDAGGGQGTIYTGAQLEAELAWYSSVAAAFADNPYVWFGTDNEPSEDPSAAALSAWQQQTYQAIRDAGNESIVMLEMNCGSTPSSCGQGYDASVYASMKNVVWDAHYYGWVVDYSTDANILAQSITGNAQAAQTLTSADGIIPVIIGEYGNSTDGQNLDPDGTQVVSAVESSGYGCMAWNWAAGPVDNLTDGSDNLTPYGQQVAQSMAQ